MLWGDESFENLDNLSGFEVVQSSLFGRRYSGPVMSISPTAILFSVTTHLALDNCECVQILVNPMERKVIVRPVTSRESEAYNWTSGEKKSSWISCPMLASRIYSIWNLDKDFRYRIQGKTIVFDRKPMILFDFNTPMIQDPIKKSTEEQG